MVGGAAHAPEAGITVWPVDGDPLRAQQRALKRPQALFVPPGGCLSGLCSTVLPWGCWALLGSCWAACWGAPSLSHWGKLARKTLPPTFHFVATQRRPAGRQQGIRVRTSYTCACLLSFCSQFHPSSHKQRRSVRISPVSRQNEKKKKKKRACRKQLCLSYTPCPVPKIACVQVGAVFDGAHWLVSVTQVPGTISMFAPNKIGTGGRVRMYSAHCVAVPISSVDCVYCFRWVLQDAVLGTKRHFLHALLSSTGC